MSSHDKADQVDPILAEAADWVVRLSADDEDDQLRHAAFEAWKKADPRHAAAAVRFEAFVSQVRSVGHQESHGARPAFAALDAAFDVDRRRASRIRRIGAALIVLVFLALPAWQLLHRYPPASLMADLRTGVGQWQDQRLPDGSRMTLTSNTAIDLEFENGKRVVTLLQGAVMVEVAKDPAHPFVVQTRHGTIRALGTRFAVAYDKNATQVSMLESKVWVQTATARAAHGDQGQVVSADQQLCFDADHLGPLRALDGRGLADAWRFHQLVVEDRPLTEVLDVLDRYRPGHISYDRDTLAGLRVNAVLPLDDTDRALQLLASNFPQLRVRTLTPYLVWVDAPASH
ncbi:FecR domain-containing protein [Pseudoxanthomonas sp.]|uniref:FecR family protein n=1 Tax=Pseudoxanthomonas sp. TaxID=1871049 RepID=UPI002614C615|nr:FecR domain-containing protein [Pseudoxanthomonas sp.]WDS36594.1 MAG: FecR domain-containing protein [Pseudoxanthomonas sp.]